MSKGSDAGASPIDQAAEKAALEWLEAITDDSINGEPFRSFARTLKALLAEPRFPAEPTWELVDTLRAMHDDNADYSAINNLGGYDNHNMRRARAVMTKMGVFFAPDREKPKTKTVEVWHVEHCVGGTPHVTVRRSLQAAEATAENAAVCGDTCVHVTGPHTQEVPND